MVGVERGERREEEGAGRGGEEVAATFWVNASCVLPLLTFTNVKKKETKKTRKKEKNTKKKDNQKKRKRTKKKKMIKRFSEKKSFQKKI